MVRQSFANDSQHDRPSRPRAEAVFRPVALPAVAAAVHATRPQPRRTPPRDLPSVLRDEAVTD